MSTVLVIDDDAMNLRMAEFALSQKGYTVLKAENGELGLQILRNAPVDLLLLDIEMPNYNGFDALSDIRQDETICEVPVIMLTASADSTDIEKSNSLGALDYIKKPFMPQDLVMHVDKVLG